MADKTHPYQCKLQYDADGTPPFTALTDLATLTPPNATKGDTRITNLDSSDKTHEYMSSWRESGEAGAKAYFTHTQFATLIGFYKSDTVYYWRYLFPLLSGQSTNGYLQFQGYVKEIGMDEISVESDDAIMVPFKIKITGPLTFSAGS